MASLGSISTSALAAYNENTLAAANFNINFALIRLDAPVEFHGVAQSLTPARRKNAEEGVSHQTARKLGALFENVFEIKKGVLKAYGQRASEISALERLNLKGKSSGGMFQEHMGADATAIWAAATSGLTAIAINMLGCMLAELFSGPEATSVWVELVTRRRADIVEECDGTEISHLALKEAARQEISRTELADWDASTRAWLRCGRRTEKERHKRLQRVLSDLDISVDGSTEPYTSVVRAFNGAMQVMDNIMRGRPQSVQNGSILLALSAWHLFPDLLVYATKEESVVFHDPLFAGAAKLTIGLSNPQPGTGEGFHWSLSLGQLQYYGAAKLVSRSARRDASRVSFDEFCLGVLGSFLSGPGYDHNDIHLCCGLLQKIFHQLKDKPFVNHPSSWPSLLERAAQTVTDSQGPELADALMLVKAGVRHGSAFLGTHQAFRPMFGLALFDNLPKLIQSTGQRVEFMRRMVRHFRLPASRLVIRYKR